MATIAVGDIHGHAAALDDLLERLTPGLTVDDQLVFLGDYLDDGPAGPACIERILECRRELPCAVVGLMGNHEQWMMRSYHDPSQHSWLLGMNGLRTMACYSPDVAARIRHEMRDVRDDLHGGRAALGYGAFFEALPPGHLEFFLGLRAFHESPHVRCVHGGCEGHRPLADQKAETVIWGPPGFPESYHGARPVVYGHRNDAVLDGDGWPRPRVTHDGRAYGIDSIRHGVLTAMRFPDGQVFQSARHDPVMRPGH